MGRRNTFAQQELHFRAEVMLAELKQVKCCNSSVDIDVRIRYSPSRGPMRRMSKHLRVKSNQNSLIDIVFIRFTTSAHSITANSETTAMS